MRNKLSSYQQETVQTNRSIILKKVFPQLRKESVLANGNYLCCQSCASYGLADSARTRKKEGYVFWHRQDEESLRRDGHLYIAFSGMDENMTTKVVGMLTVKLLEEAGLTVEWNGSEDKRILVDLTKRARTFNQPTEHPLDMYAGLGVA